MDEKNNDQEFIPLRLDRNQGSQSQNPYGAMAHRPSAQAQPQPQPTGKKVEPLSLEEWREMHDVPKQPDTKAEKARSRRGKKPRYHGRKRVSPYGLSCLLFILIFLTAVIGLYVFAPQDTNILVLGLDRSLEENGWLSRSDTIILTNVKFTRAEVKLLSIPRDLWMNIPGYGENRINTAHYFGEVYDPGSGPSSAINTVEANFGVSVDHYVRVKLEEFPALIDAMGGITIILEEPMGGLEAGTHTLNGDEALAFVRDRAGTDDFYRMAQAQQFIQMLINQLKQPKTWFRLPKVIGVAQGMIDTDIPFWQWPRYGMALLRAYPEKVESATLPRTMATPYITAEGANVLLPDWNQIWPFVQDMFAKPGLMQQLIGPTE
jgi:LCP family protein required for cell wall assembly